jgi:hypothetical protein
MKQDVNRFVDDVYAPFQIQFILAKQKERQLQGDENNLFSVQEKALRNPKDAQAQKDLLLVMQAIVEAIRDDVEEYRRIRLAPVLQQEKEVLAEIERVYDYIERGNATVTTYLASVVKVNEAQDELLKKVDMEGLRQKIGTKLSDTSDQLSNYVGKAKKLEGNVDEVKKKVDKMTSELDKLLKGE